MYPIFNLFSLFSPTDTWTRFSFRINFFDLYKKGKKEFNKTVYKNVYNCIQQGRLFHCALWCFLFDKGFPFQAEYVQSPVGKKSKGSRIQSPLSSREEDVKPKSSYFLPRLEAYFVSNEVQSWKESRQIRPDKQGRHVAKSWHVESKGWAKYFVKMQYFERVLDFWGFYSHKKMEIYVEKVAIIAKYS